MWGRGTVHTRSRKLLPLRRKVAKFGTMLFRPKGKIFLRSRAFARDDGPRPVFAGDTPSFARGIAALCVVKYLFWAFVLRMSPRTIGTTKQ